MRGAIIFVIAFFVLLAVTLAYQDLPPAKAMYDAVVGVEADYELLGIPATQLIIAVFNGAIYGIIIWLIYTLAEKVRLKGKKQASS